MSLKGELTRNFYRNYPATVLPYVNRNGFAGAPAPVIYPPSFYWKSGGTQETNKVLELAIERKGVDGLNCFMGPGSTNDSDFSQYLTTQMYCQQPDYTAFDDKAFVALQMLDPGLTNYNNAASSYGVMQLRHYLDDPTRWALAIGGVTDNLWHIYPFTVPLNPTANGNDGGHNVGLLIHSKTPVYFAAIVDGLERVRVTDPGDASMWPFGNIRNTAGEMYIGFSVFSGAMTKAAAIFAQWGALSVLSFDTITQGSGNI